MKKTFLPIIITFIAVIMTLASCNNIDEVANTHLQQREDVELSKLYYSIDSLQNEYIIPNSSRVNWDKWGRRGLNCVVDGFVSFALAGTGPLVALFAGGAASGLYEDYLDYMVRKANNNGYKQRLRSYQNESSIQAVVFPVENPTFIDSIGYYHNMILNEIASNGKSYTNDDGDINYNAYLEDVLTVAKDNGIISNYVIDTQLLFTYLETIIKPLASLDLGEQEDLIPDNILTILFNDTYNGFNFDSAEICQQREACEKNHLQLHQC